MSDPSQTNTVWTKGWAPGDSIPISELPTITVDKGGTGRTDGTNLVPAGGDNEAVLAKRSDSDFDTEWVTLDEVIIPDDPITLSDLPTITVAKGGTSRTDGANLIPAGGDDEAVLTKRSAGDFDAEWVPLDDVVIPDVDAQDPISIISRSANYTVSRNNDNNTLIVVDTSSQNVTITLPDLNNADAGFLIRILKSEEDRTVTINAGSGQTIEGVSAVALEDQYEAFTIVWVGASYYIVGHRQIDEGSVPAGAVMGYTDNTIPSGWTLGNGGTLSRTGDGARLFALWGTRYGSGNGSTTFNKPDYRGRMIVGRRNADSLGDEGGARTHTLVNGEMPQHEHSAPRHTHTTPNHTHSIAAHSHTGPNHSHSTPSHSHSISSHSHSIPSHTHIYDATRTGGGDWVSGSDNGITGNTENTGSGGGGSTGFGGSGSTSFDGSGATGAAGTGLTSSVALATNSDGSATTNQNAAANTGNEGSDDPHNNMPPYHVANWIIKL